MFLLSQNDPIYKNLKLGKSKLSVQGYGCFVMSLGTLFQKTYQNIKNIPGGITDSGLVDAAQIAKYCGGSALPVTVTPPKGWCIAMTNHYMNQGFPTHFFLVNWDTQQQIDPLDFPAQVEPLKYNVVNFRPFTGVKLSTLQSWQEEAKEYAIDNGILTGGWDTPEQPMSQVRQAQAFKNFEEHMVRKYGLVPLP